MSKGISTPITIYINPLAEIVSPLINALAIISGFEKFS